MNPMLILVNHDAELGKKFLSEELSMMTPEARLDYLYNTHVKGNWDMEHKLSELSIKDPPSHFPKKTLVMKDIEFLIKKYGWREFGEGLTKFCELKMKEMEVCGLFDAKEAWESCRDRIKGLRKNVQL